MSKNYWENQGNESWKKQISDQMGEEAGLSGLQQFMVQTFTWMALGLALTGFVSFMTYSSETLFSIIFGNPIVFWGLIIGEFALVIGFGFAMRKGVSAGILLAMFIGYAAMNGLTLAAVLYVHTMESVATTFFVSSAMFGGMAAYGYVTKTDLTSMGRMAGMALWGIIIAMIANFFIGSSLLATGISVIGVLVFTALTAYDTQKLKGYYAAYSHDESALKRAGLGGALMLYLDFINLFLMLLRLMGNRR